MSNRVIGLSAAFLQANTGGAATYTWELTRALGQLLTADDLVLYVPTRIQAPFAMPGNVHMVDLGFEPGNAMARLRCDLRGIWKRADTDGVQLMHFLNGVASNRRGVPTVVTMYDVIFEHHRDAYPAVDRRVVGHLFHRAASRADAILTISQSSAQDIAQIYRVSPEKLHVAHCGPGRLATPATNQERDDVRRAYGLSRREFVLSVTSEHPYKNSHGLIAAMARAQQARPDVTLVLAGNTGKLQNELTSLATQEEAAVVFTGRVTDRELEALYAESSLLVCPSLAEGFGLPVLEGLSRQVPVLANSGCAPFREVGGDAITYADATAADLFGRSILDALDQPRDSHWRDAIAGRVALFSWERTALAVSSVYANLG